MVAVNLYFFILLFIHIFFHFFAVRSEKIITVKRKAHAGVGVTGYAVTCVTVEPVGYASFFGVYVTIGNREPGCVTNLRNHA